MSQAEHLEYARQYAADLKLKWVEPAAGERIVAMLSEDGLLIYHCPGCGRCHGLPTHKPFTPNGHLWQWNGSLVRPTLEPSINQPGDSRLGRCHHWLRDGVLEFLSDSEHKLAGKKVALRPEDV